MVYMIGDSVYVAMHLEQQQQGQKNSRSKNKAAGKHHQDRNFSSPTKGSVLGEDQPLSTQYSGETHSGTSSLEDIFGNVEDDDFDDCYSESSQESRSMDRLFATSYSDHNSKFISGYSKTGSKMSSWEQYSARKEDRTAMLSSKTELLRCGSVDTAKASNLTYDPAADRAKFLELQALLNQQQEEQRKRLNAPPIEFDAPDGDNVIRVRDAVCEIEVLPKNDPSLCQSHTAAEF